MDFSELVETIRAEEAGVRELFGGEGQGIRQAGLKGPEYLSRVAEAAQFVADIYEGRRPVAHLREAMTTSDFPLLFGDVLDRQLLAAYKEFPVPYRAYTRISTVPDFRLVNRFAVDGAESVLQRVGQQEEYPTSSLQEARYQYSVAKYGRRIPFAWETMVNDDLDALKTIPARFGRAARRSEQKFVTGLHVNASGPHASFYTVGNRNIVTGNPTLSTAALQTALQLLAAQTDTESEPIWIEAVHLVVPPALEITARNILNALQLEITEAGGTSGQKLIAENWVRNRLKLSVDPYIPIVASTANGSTSWFLFADPNLGERPALEMGFLRGHTEPEIFVKEPNARRVGGGSVAAMSGDFGTDSIEYKVRHVFGGTRLDARMSVASNGSGS